MALIKSYRYGRLRKMHDACKLVTVLENKIL